MRLLSNTSLFQRRQLIVLKRNFCLGTVTYSPKKKFVVSHWYFFLCTKTHHNIPKSTKNIKKDQQTPSPDHESRSLSGQWVMVPSLKLYLKTISQGPDTKPCVTWTMNQKVGLVWFVLVPFDLCASVTCSSLMGRISVDRHVNSPHMLHHHINSNPLNLLCALKKSRPSTGTDRALHGGGDQK